MKQPKWFERKFDFSGDQNIFPAIVERLSGTPLRLRSKVEGVPDDLLERRFDDKWSIKEHIGHLIDLEPLWQRRLQDILRQVEVMEAADLENKKTWQAMHNKAGIDELLGRFQEIRELSLQQLAQLQEKDVYKSALHPRLNKPMRVLDLFLFVAEHDDHHLVSISEIRGFQH